MNKKYPISQSVEGSTKQEMGIFKFNFSAQLQILQWGNQERLRCVA